MSDIATVQEGASKFTTLMVARRLVVKPGVRTVGSDMVPLGLPGVTCISGLYS